MASPSAPRPPKIIGHDASDDSPTHVTSVEHEAPDITLWIPLRSWIQCDPSRRVLVWALGLLLVQAVFRGFVMFGGWFLYDDLSFIERASTMPLWSTDYLFESWNGHVMPGAFVWVHLLTSLWPMQYAPVVISGLLLQAIAGIAMYLLLVELFGRRPAILVPLSFYLLTAITLPATLWWAAALNQLPGITAVTLMLWCHARYHRNGKVGTGLLGVTALLVGLLFSEKVLLAVPVIFLFTLLYFSGGRPWHRLRSCLSRHRTVWSAYAVASTLYVAYYLVLVPSPVNGKPTAVVALKTMGQNLVYGVIPAIYGGPFRWDQLGVGGIAAAPTAMVFIAAVITALLVAWSVLRNYRAVFGWLVIVGYWAVNAFILGMTRAPWVGPVIGREYRYSTDLAVIIAVFATLACLPLAGHWRRGDVQLLVPRRGIEATPTERHGTPVAWFASESILAGGISIALVVASVITTTAFDADWRNEITPRFFNTIRDDLGSLNQHVTMANLILPQTAAPSGAVLGVNARTATASMANRPGILLPGKSSDNLYTIDDDGHVTPVVVDGFTSKPGPEPRCGWRVRDEPTEIPLMGTTMDWQWYVQVDYVASLEADTTVTSGTLRTPVHIKPGVNRFYLMSNGPVDSLKFDGLTYGSLCTDHIAVGFAKPLITPKS